MPAPNHLNSEQKEKLQKALKEEENAYIREIVLILLLLNDGKTQVQISKLIGCSLRTVSYWCIHGDANNLDSLKDKRMEGNYRKATDEYIKILLDTIDKYPQEMGYEFGRWTAKRLATYLTEQTGIELSSSQVTNIKKKKKYVYIWAKYSLEDRQYPEKRKEFNQKLAEYLKIAKEEPNKLQVWFWDGAFKVATQVRHTAPHESGFSLREHLTCAMSINAYSSQKLENLEPDHKEK